MEFTILSAICVGFIGVIYQLHRIEHLLEESLFEDEDEGDKNDAS